MSSEHLSLTWRDGAWHLRDLGSRNGTTVNGARIRPGEERALIRGDRLGLGPYTLALVDDAGPEPIGRRLPGGELRGASGGVLALPDEERPLLTVFQGEDGAWLGERAGEEEEVFDGDVVTLEGEAWMLHLPRGHVATVEARASLVHFEFAVSSDEETVDLLLILDGARHLLPARAHYYTLLTLARARHHDAAHGRGGRAGWRSVADLCHLLRCDENKLNVDIFRCRQDLGRAGLATASSVVERRRTARELRFRPEAVSIARRGL